MLNRAFIVSILLALIVPFLPSISVSEVSALSAKQKALYGSGIYWYDTDGGASCGVGLNTINSGGLNGVPEPYNDLFNKASVDHGIDPAILASVFFAENRDFPDPPPPYGDGDSWPVSSSNAKGPFQFLNGTWAGFREDANDDGTKDINDLADASHSAANYIESLGGVPNLPLGGRSDEEFAQTDTETESRTVARVFKSYNAGPNTWLGADGLWYRVIDIKPAAWDDNKQKEINNYIDLGLKTYLEVSGARLANQAGGCTNATASDVQFQLYEAFTGPLLTSVDAIVLHYTGGVYDKNPDDVVEVLKNRDPKGPCGAGGCSVQLYIDQIGTVWQLMPQVNSVAKQACGANSYSIGIEIEGTGQDMLLSNSVQKQSVLDTVVKLISLYPSIDPNKQDPDEVEGLLSHQEVSKDRDNCSTKSDPGQTYMDQMRANVRSAILNGSLATASCPPGVDESAKYQNNCSALSQIISSNQPAFNDLKQTRIDNGRLLPESATSSIGKTRIATSSLSDYQNMFAAAKADGVFLEPVSGYRTFEEQALQRLEFCTPNNTFSEVFTALRGDGVVCNPLVSRPGRSEHNKGRAIDFGINGETDECTYQDTAAYAWLVDNAANFSFRPLTGSACEGLGEPWHWEQ